MENLDKALLRVKRLDNGLSQSIEQEMVMLRDLDKDICADVDDHGFVVYGRGERGMVLATIHGGRYLPGGFVQQQQIDKEADLFTGELYLPIFLENGGVWITTHVSRCFADLNRPSEDAVNYTLLSTGGDLVRHAEAYYGSFYGKALQYLDGAGFLFSGHSMDAVKKGDARGDLCIIYKQAQEGAGLKAQLEAKGFDDVRINDPFVYKGGYFRVYADLSVGGSVEFETNKRLYLEGTAKSDRFDDVSKRIAGAVKEHLK
jgi:hypothetical protein